MSVLARPLFLSVIAVGSDTTFLRILADHRIIVVQKAIFRVGDLLVRSILDRDTEEIRQF
jgi:hypothetical protein